MALLVSLALFAFIVLLVTAYGYYRYAKPARVLQQVGGAAVEEPSFLIGERKEAVPNPFITIVRHLGEKVPVSPQEASSTRKYLFAAGYRSANAVSTYYGLRLLSAAVFLLIGFVIQVYFIDTPIFRLLALLGAAAAGYGLPSLVLDRLVSKRREELRLSLPDALDLLVICVEAGVGLDQAIQKVSQELDITHKEISEELALVNLEMRAGKRRAEALQNLADRTGVRAIRQLVSVLQQTDRFGTSMAESLRVHSDFLRVQRRQEAEERAGKVGVKLVFPIFFFILPSMVLVAGGPALLAIIKELGPLMRQAGGQ